MTDRATIARQAAEALLQFTDTAGQTSVFVGFDGFVDTILAVVDKWRDDKQYEPVPTIQRFGEKILAAAGKSGNYEMIVKQQKLGGNGPITAHALAAFGLNVTYVGALGRPSIHPVFEPLAGESTCYSVAEPGYTDALEFDDGKLMFGRRATLDDINWQRLGEVVGHDNYAAILARSQLISMVNWTMLPRLDEIWQHMIDDVLPKLAGGEQGRRHIFIDLTDPEKRTADDLYEALQLCSKFALHGNVTLGMNLKESTQVAAVLDIDVPSDSEAAIESTAQAIREKLALTTVLIHPRRGAAGASIASGSQVTASFVGPLVTKPKLSTGAGDNFNAGYCLGELAGLPLEQCLCVGTATSGYYVRHAGSPPIPQLADFCESLPEPESSTAV